MAVAVVDLHGFLVAFGRDDAVAPAIGGFAVDKAYSAATLRKATADFGERMAASPTLALGVGTRERLVTWEVECLCSERGIASERLACRVPRTPKISNARLGQLKAQDCPSVDGRRVSPASN